MLIEGAHCVLGGPLCVCGAISLSSLSRGKRCGFGPICASFAFRFLNLDGNGIDFEPIPRQAGGTTGEAGRTGVVGVRGTRA